MKKKVYEIKIGYENTWVCADTAIEALKTYLSGTDTDMIDLENEDDMVEVQKKNWDKMNILDIEKEMDDEGNYPVIMTFSEYMETEATTSDIIATTAY